MHPLPAEPSTSYLLNLKPNSSNQSSPGTALVTGAADRIGAAIAKAHARDGWRLVDHYRSSAAKADDTVAQIRALGGEATAVRADLANRRERAELVTVAASVFGPLTLLVNNASTFERDSARDIDEALWDAHFAVHAEAPAFLARDFASQLPAGTPGNIVNIVDERVLDLSPAFFSYTLSKSVLWTMTRTLAQSLAPHIRVNAIGPGPTIAPPGVSSEGYRRRQAELPLGRGATPDEVAAAVLSIVNTSLRSGQLLSLVGCEHRDWAVRRGLSPRKTAKCPSLWRPARTSSAPSSKRCHPRQASIA